MICVGLSDLFSLSLLTCILLVYSLYSLLCLLDIHLCYFLHFIVWKIKKYLYLVVWHFLSLYIPLLETHFSFFCYASLSSRIGTHQDVYFMQSLRVLSSTLVKWSTSYVHFFTPQTCSISLVILVPLTLSLKKNPQNVFEAQRNWK